MSTLNLSRKSNAGGSFGAAVRFRGPQDANRRILATASRLPVWSNEPEKDVILNGVADVLRMEARGWARAEALKDWGSCRCLVHEALVHGVEGAPGCLGKSHGRAGMIRALYEGNDRACVVVPGVRAKDKRMFMFAEFGMGNVGEEPLKTFAKGFGTLPEALGAFYCYTLLFPVEIVMRIARLLGPFPLKNRLLRYLIIFGQPVACGVKLDVLPDGNLHFERSGCDEIRLPIMVKKLLGVGVPESRVGAVEADVGSLSVVGLLNSVPDCSDQETLPSADGGVELSNVQLKEMIDEAILADEIQRKIVPGVRLSRMAVVNVQGRGSPGDLFGYPEYILYPHEYEVHVKNPRMRKLRTWLLASAGIDIPESAMVDLAIASCAVGKLPTVFERSAERAGVWALVGGTALNSVAAMYCCSRGARPMDYDRARERFGNVSLSIMFKESGLRDCCDVGTLMSTSLVDAMMVQAIVGVVHYHVSQMAVVKFCESLGLLIYEDFEGSLTRVEHGFDWAALMSVEVEGRASRTSVDDVTVADIQKVKVMKALGLF